MSNACDVLAALRQSKKGCLKYDKYWEEDGRTQEILDNITSQSTSLSISPTALLAAKSPESLREEVRTSDNTEDEVSPHTAPVNNKASHDDEIDAIHYLIQQNEKELLIVEYETKKLKSMQQVYGRKQTEYDEFTHHLQQQAENLYQLQKQKNEIEALHKIAELQQAEKLYLKAYEEKNGMLANKTSNQVNNDVDRTAAVICQNGTISPKAVESEVMKDNLKLYTLHQNLLLKIVPKIEDNIRTLQQENHHTFPINDWIFHLTQLVQSFSNLLVECQRTTSTSKDHVNKAQAVLGETQNLLQKTCCAVDHLKVEAEKQEINKITTSSQQPEIPVNDSQKGTNAALPPISEQTIQEIPDTEPTDVSNVDDMEECENEIVVEEKETRKNKSKSQLAQFIDPETFRDYCNVLENLKSVKTSLESFRTDPKYKKYRLELHKAVAINTISDSSGTQLKNRIRHLIALLSGQPVEIGGRYTSCKNHPLAVNYCKNLLAEKLVTQGEEQVQSRISAAFPFAAVAVTLCAQFPDLWLLLLGHFYTRCPYLVPYYPPKEEGQSDDEYFINLGYKYTNDKPEEKTNFLKRMSGFVGLYAAIIQTNPAPGFPAQQMSCSLERGWSWLARCLNLDPRPDITATVLLAFLDVVGHALLRTYNKQFKKLLHTLCKEHFPKIKQITPPTSGGPVGRLEDFLQSAIKKGHISQPEGILGAHFWRT